MLKTKRAFKMKQKPFFTILKRQKQENYFGR